MPGFIPTAKQQAALDELEVQPDIEADAVVTGVHIASQSLVIRSRKSRGLVLLTPDGRWR